MQSIDKVQNRRHATKWPIHNTEQPMGNAKNRSMHPIHLTAKKITTEAIWSYSQCTAYWASQQMIALYYNSTWWVVDSGGPIINGRKIITQQIGHTTIWAKQPIDTTQPNESYSQLGHTSCVLPIHPTSTCECNPHVRAFLHVMVCTSHMSANMCAHSFSSASKKSNRS